MKKSIIILAVLLLIPIGITVKAGEHFDEGKILNISFADYCKANGKLPSDYSLVGVHSKSMDGFLEKVPEGTEVVVNYELTVVATRGNLVSFLTGTALIPKPGR